MDHVFPKALGGIAKVACCVLCNNIKGDMTPTEWLAYVIEEMPHRADAVRAVFRAVRINWIELPNALGSGAEPTPETAMRTLSQSA